MKDLLFLFLIIAITLGSMFIPELSNLSFFITFPFICYAIINKDKIVRLLFPFIVLAGIISSLIYDVKNFNIIEFAESNINYIILPLFLLVLKRNKLFDINNFSSTLIISFTAFFLHLIHPQASFQNFQNLLHFNLIFDNPNFNSAIISFLIMFININLARIILLKTSSFEKVITASIALLTLLPINNVSFIESTKKFKTLIIQEPFTTNNEQVNSVFVSTARVNHLLEQTKKNLRPNQDIVVWSENILAFSYTNNDSPMGQNLIKKIESFVKENDIKLLVLGTHYNNNNKNALSGALAITPHKTKLIPKKFFVPYIELDDGSSDNISVKDKIVSIDGIDFLITICYELYRDEIYHTKTDAVINVSNEQIFLLDRVGNLTRNKTESLSKRYSMPIIKSANPNNSLITEDTGSLLSILSNGMPGVIQKEIKINKRVVNPINEISIIVISIFVYLSCLIWNYVLHKSRKY